MLRAIVCFLVAQSALASHPSHYILTHPLQSQVLLSNVFLTSRLSPRFLASQGASLQTKQQWIGRRRECYAGGRRPLPLLIPIYSPPPRPLSDRHHDRPLLLGLFRPYQAYFSFIGSLRPLKVPLSILLAYAIAYVVPSHTLLPCFCPFILHCLVTLHIIVTLFFPPSIYLHLTLLFLLLYFLARIPSSSQIIPRLCSP